MQMTENFKYKTTIDWIKLEVTTVEDTNFHAIKVLFRVNFVESINPKDGGAANAFRLVIHDVTSWRALIEKIELAKYVKPMSISIVGIEISLDAFSINNDKNGLIEKTAEFFWLLQNPCSKNIRAAGQYNGSAEQLTSHSSTMRKIANQKSIYIGSQKDDTISQRIYYKTTNNRKSLPIDHHSARYEITLRENDCPFHTIEEAQKYNFAELASWFKFRKVREDLPALNLMLVNANRQLGSINTRRIAGGGTKVGNYGTSADSKLNRMAYNKLRELTKRLGKIRVVRKSRVIDS